MPDASARERSRIRSANRRNASSASSAASFRSRASRTRVPAPSRSAWLRSRAAPMASIWEAGAARGGERCRSRQAAPLPAPVAAARGLRLRLLHCTRNTWPGTAHQVCDVPLLVAQAAAKCDGCIAVNLAGLNRLLALLLALLPAARHPSHLFHPLAQLPRRRVQDLGGPGSGSPPLGPFPARPNSATHPRFAPPLPHLVLEHHDARPVPRIEVVHAQLAALRRRFLQAGIALRCERTHGPRGSGRGQRRSLVSGTHGHPTSAHPRAAVGRRRGPSRDKWRQRPLRVWSTLCKS